MWFVYFLQSINYDFLYIGHTNDVNRRLREHDEGLNKATRPYAPFRIRGYVAVPTETQAIALEHYFKTGSGKAVLKKRILAAG